MNTAERTQLLLSAFLERYGRAPQLIARAPGRVDAMGSHTDYNGGCVLTLSIDRDTWLVAAPRTDGVVNLQSINLPDTFSFPSSAGSVNPASGWPLYPQAVFEMFRQRNLPVPGCDILVHGTLPLASGLSSSASLEAATAVLCNHLADAHLSLRELAVLCQQAENRIVGVNCGILDQYSVLLGEQDQMLLLDCQQLTHRYAPLPSNWLPVICNTRSPRQLSDSAYGERRRDCEEGVNRLRTQLPDINCLRDVDLESFARLESSLPTRVAQRCRFVIEENLRVRTMAEALASGDVDATRETCQASWFGARNQYEICNDAMEAMYTAASSAPGVISVRQAGAGFGGCMLALVERDSIDAFTQHSAASYKQNSEFEGEFYAVRSAPGAQLMDWQAV